MIHVAVGVVVNNKQQLLIAKRAAHQHQGGLWEFPGGKVEANESVTQALARELKEELNIELMACEPLITVPHQYKDKSVLLDTWLVSQIAGEPVGMEGQAIKWVALNELEHHAFPQGNIPIISAIKEKMAYR